MWRGLMLTRAVEHFLARRRLGRARLPAHRHAAGHRRRADGPGPHAPPHRADHRDDAGGQRPEGGDPGRRHGPQELPPRGRGDREHERVHVRSRHRPTRCSASGGGQTLADEVGAAARPDPDRARRRRRRRCRRAGRARRRARRPRPSAPSPTRSSTEAVPPVAMAGCSARMLDAVEAALGPGARPLEIRDGRPALATAIGHQGPLHLVVGLAQHGERGWGDGGGEEGHDGEDERPRGEEWCCEPGTAGEYSTPGGHRRAWCRRRRVGRRCSPGRGATRG